VKKRGETKNFVGVMLGLEANNILFYFVFIFFLFEI
jgi:hypothetical protein